MSTECDGEDGGMTADEPSVWLYSEQFTLINQGAEARVYEGIYLGKPVIVKERFQKKYRHPILDETITKERLKAEIRCMQKCRQAGIRVPTLYYVDALSSRIYMEQIKGAITVKEYIQSVEERLTSAAGGAGDGPTLASELKFLSTELGLLVATMHAANVVHGDLTTSNMLINPDSRDVTLIDFGLSYYCQLAEDKGVDLYVLERALLSTHPYSTDFFADILLEYSNAKGRNKGAKAVIKKLDEVRLRGRKRDMVG